MYRNTAVDDDYRQIAEYSNLNNKREIGVWCKTENDWVWEDSKGVVNKKGENFKLFFQVNDSGTKVVSFFVAFEYKSGISFFVGIVDPSMENYMDVWRYDAALCFDYAVKSGFKEIRILLSDDNNEIVDWMEKEVCMTRVNNMFVWIINTKKVKDYINATI